MEPSDAQVGFLVRDGRPTNAYEETMQRLLQSIRLGIIAPGQRLPSERDLADMLKVSRDTVREAISTLVEAGYVVSRRGRYGGTFVREELPDPLPSDPTVPPPSEAEIDDVFILRRVLEVGAVRVAAGRELSSADRAALFRALEESAAADVPDYRRLDSRLHLLIAELTGSRSLVQAMADMRTRVNRVLDSIPVLPPNLAHSSEQHAEIVSAILAGRPDAAAEAMLAHVEGSEALMRGFHATRSHRD